MRPRHVVDGGAVGPAESTRDALSGVGSVAIRTAGVVAQADPAAIRRADLARTVRELHAGGACVALLGGAVDAGDAGVMRVAVLHRLRV